MMLPIHTAHTRTSPIRSLALHVPPAAVAAAIVATVAAALLAAAPVVAQPAPQTAPPAANARTQQQVQDAEIYIVPLTVRDGYPVPGVPLNLTRHPGYDNQPSFAPDNRAFVFTSDRGNGNTDIYRYDLVQGAVTALRKTSPESEYSATLARDGKSVYVVRVEADSTQRLWSLSLSGGIDAPLFPDVKPVGYYAQANDSTWAMFVLGSPATLQIGVTGRAGTQTAARNIGRSILRIPGTERVSFVQKGSSQWFVMSFNAANGKVDTLVTTPQGIEDFAWLDSTTLLAGKGSSLFAWKSGTSEWKQIGDFSFAYLNGITRLAVSGNRANLLMVANAQPRARTASGAALIPDPVDAGEVGRRIGVLASDAMMGRRTGTPGGAAAADWIANEFREAGLQPAGDAGTFLQQVPVRAMTAPDPLSPNRLNVRAVASVADLDTVAPERRLKSANVVGVIRGSDPVLSREVILVTAHYDHLGVGRIVDGDSIYNGADDDASGTIAIIEMARRMKEGPRPKRTIVFAAVTGEEVGMIGTNWFIKHPYAPLEDIVANLNIEMIGRPDDLAGGFGKAWLTGYERSTMGDLLADNSIPLIPDLRPAQNFFRRSDNYAFAALGIPAHTISSFNGHTDYHTAKDEVSTIDTRHMAAVISASTSALRLLADGEKPQWHPGGIPPTPQAR